MKFVWVLELHMWFTSFSLATSATYPPARYLIIVVNLLQVANG